MAVIELWGCQPPLNSKEQGEEEVEGGVYAAGILVKEEERGGGIMQTPTT